MPEKSIAGEGEPGKAPQRDPVSCTYTRITGFRPVVERIDMRFRGHCIVRRRSVMDAAPITLATFGQA
jgi:hypothetical protein